MNQFIVWMQFLTKKNEEQKPHSHFIKVNTPLKPSGLHFQNENTEKDPPPPNP